MKYIHHKELGLIAFEIQHNHKQFVERLGLAEADVVSAGFISADSVAVLRINCGSNSVGLNKCADPLDTKRLQSNITVAKGLSTCRPSP